MNKTTQTLALATLFTAGAICLQASTPSQINREQGQSRTVQAPSLSSTQESATHMTERTETPFAVNRMRGQRDQDLTQTISTGSGMEASKPTPAQLNRLKGGGI